MLRSIPRSRRLPGSQRIMRGFIDLISDEGIKPPKIESDIQSWKRQDRCGHQKIRRQEFVARRWEYGTVG